jgi:hypothetical protein
MTTSRWPILGGLLLLVLGTRPAWSQEGSEVELPRPFWDANSSWLSRNPVWTQEDAALDLFCLLVRLDSEGLEVNIPVTESSSFTTTKRSGPTKIKITGKFGRAIAGKFPLELTICKWTSAADNSTETMRLELEPDKACSAAPVLGIAFLRTVLLKRLESTPTELENDQGVWNAIGGDIEP